MRLFHVSESDIAGGACRASYRIHQSLAQNSTKPAIVSQVRVISKLSDDPAIIGGWPSLGLSMLDRLDRKFLHRFRNSSGFSSANTTMFSVAWPATGLGRELADLHQEGKVDLVHIHWLGDRTLSIEEMGRLPMPLVWTLHDQWAFCGAEHYTTPPLNQETESSDNRYVLGYSKTNRPAHETGPDLNRITWLRKRRAWRRPMHIVCPSQWMADCARRSKLMRHWPVCVIPNPIDLNRWAPLDQREARALLDLPQDRPLVLFGALGGTVDSRKGADLLFDALQKLRQQVIGLSVEKLELVVFGQGPPLHSPDLGFPIHYMGRFHDDISLRLLYAAADLFVIPSRQDNLPNTGIEAQACATPVVAFRTGGLTDIVEHCKTGYLADPFDSSSLAASIYSVLDDPQRRIRLGAAARQRAEKLWDPQRVAQLYAEVYKQASAVHL
jgi:glycosyltransferase involved in cell wall biosynthesis